ncbi:MAG: hypothetical protein B6D58_00895 [candidate division Zixibacteria bacterium 4484_95]|nr:MAG: hypothetical protein B6D58_00895 [candidate division Zixibacteria bacterium 4484_95]
MDALKIIIVGLIIGLFATFSFQSLQPYCPTKDVVNTGIGEVGDDRNIERIGGGVKYQKDREIDISFNPRQGG